MNHLWRFNEVTGMWIHQRRVREEEQSEWLQLFQKDDPKSVFLLSKTRPNYEKTKKILKIVKGWNIG
jgi:hypothetical protein